MTSSGEQPTALKAKGYADVSWVSRLFFSYVNPIIDWAAVKPLEEQDAEWLTPTSDEAHTLAASFELAYEDVKRRYADPAPGLSVRPMVGRKPWTTLIGITLLRLYWWPMVLESLWVLAEVAQRLGTPVALREFLRWLQDYSAGADPPEWKGWLWAVVLGLCGYSMVIIHHQLFWIGMRMGFTMRQQTVAAIHAKVLRLNSAAVSALSTGHVVNLVSNDVRRFDDVMPFWIFLWAAPLELAMVLLMVSLELDFVSALAGVATSLAMIPLQSALVRYIGGLRRNTARCTDERVRLAGEVVEGALAMKMLSWEDPFADALRAIRGRETFYSRRMQRIRGINYAMQFCITPIVSFVTFAVFRARNGTLNVASVFYALSLLHLPKLYMVNFFVLAVQTLTELRVSLQRIDTFLSTPEPPHPAQEPGAAQSHQQQRAANPKAGVDGTKGNSTPPRQSFQAATPGAAGGGGVLRRSLELVLGAMGSGAGRRSREGGAATVAAVPEAAGGDGALPLGYVALRGADYDWARPFGRDDVIVRDTHGTALGGGEAAAAARTASKTARSDTPKKSAQAATAEGGAGESGAVEGAGPGGLTMYGVRFEAAPGELLGVCGAVGCGKSSLLAALLGELQPLEQSAATVRVAEAAAPAPAGEKVPELQECVASGASRVKIELHSPDGDVPASRGGTSGTAAMTGSGTKPTASASTSAGNDKGPIVRGRIAYCSQVPWIVAGSVRENILFGAPWDEQWYGRVVQACCLIDDLAGLPAGDATELGERGINLSGGQKARVALARACYARPAVALLDDPLSAVDPRVGRDLFARAIGPGGLLDECGATRLLVTHQRQYLPKCDRVLVLRQGRLVALGPWREIAALRLPELTAGHGGIGNSGGDGDGDGQMAAETTVDEALDDMAIVGGVPVRQEDAAHAAAAAVEAEAAPAGGDGTPGGSRGGVSASASSSSADAAIQVQAPPEAPYRGADEDAGDAATTSGTSPGDAAPRKAIPPAAAGKDGSFGGVASRFWRARSGRTPYADDDDGGGAGSVMSRFWRAGGGAGGADVGGGGRFWRMGSGVGSQAKEPRAGDEGKDGGRSDISRFWRVKSSAAGGGGGGGGGPGASSAPSIAERYRLSMSRTFAAGRFGGLLGFRKGESRADEGGKAAVQKTESGKLVANEDRITGTVAWSVYGSYCRHMGLLAAVLICAALFAGQAVFLASEWWLAMWSRANDEDQGQDRWLWVYGMLTGIVIVLSFLRSATFFEATVTAATSIHNAMARRVLRAPLAFFHVNPSGRIVNRFSKDQGQVDDLLPSCLFDALQSGFQVFGAFVLAAIAVPVILPVFLPLIIAFYWIRHRYITASREIKRWEAVTRSPVFASFSATLKGLPTIRAYGAADRFNDAFLNLMAHNGQWYFAIISTARWIGVRLDAVAGTTLLAAALLAMATRSDINTGVMALALAHVLQLTGLMQWVVRQSAEVENTMTSVERMLAYTRLDSEPPRVAEGAAAPPAGWPRSGALTYDSVTAVYRPGLPPVLRDISFRLAPGTSCGVVGRTGSGKSSLMLTLFRLIDVTQGTICLDGLDTAAMGLDALRRQLAIIPQDPVLFSGTLRSNLDPWRSHGDDALWGVLEAVQLRAAVAGMPGGLDAAMSECGGNLSVGQRQLFCLARALLQDAKVLALDEATANVDRATDALIQRALRDFAHRDREAHGRVLLVIAHRIDTILDTDHLLVLSAGQLVESGAPTQLAEGDGVFARMVAAARLAGAVGTAQPAAGAAVAGGGGASAAALAGAAARS